MGVSVTTQTAPYVDNLVVDVDADESPENDVLSGPCTVFIFDIDNSNNIVPAYGKFFDATSITLDGTSSSTEPELILLCPKQTRQTVTITGFAGNGATADGIPFFTGLTFACTSGAETTSNSGVQNPVTIRIMAE